ncbi:hypothetical protein SK128_009767, partial [Halocaridina rubra]
MALIKSALGKVGKPFEKLLCTPTCAVICLLVLLIGLLSKPSDARSHSFDNNSVPPVGNKLEQEVVSAIRLRAHSASNTTVSPTHVLENNFFTDNGEKTLSRFTDPRQFFTHLASKNFTSVSSGARRAFSSAVTSNETSPDVRQIVIISQNKGMPVDDGSEDKPDDQKLDKTAKSREKHEIKTRGGYHKSSKVTLKKSGKSSDKQDEEDRKGSEDEYSSSRRNIFPTAVIHETDDDHKAHQNKTGGEVKPSREIESKESKKLEEDKGEADEQLDKNAESEKITKDSNKTATSEDRLDIEDLDVSSEKTDYDIAKSDEVDKREEKEETTEKGSRSDKEDKEKVEKQKAESEDASPVKKKSDPQKKEKKKGEDTEKQKSSEAVDESGAKSDEEKAEDTLETYSQFTQRVSAEKKNDASNGHGTNGHSKGSKVKGKNYASPDCGAKLVTANPESSHSSKVIHPSKDEYMLNKCRDKIWFIIELCESIRPQKFDIANFELFSNLPKDIQVFGSHRYPSRDWTSFGWFKGQEGNRGLQSFRTETEDFFKYIKVEVTSYYGSEFFCPISSFQIFGLSEFEVIDTIEDAPEDNDDDNEPFIDVVEEASGKKTKEDGKQGVIPTVLKNMFSGVLDVIKRGYRPSSSASEAGEDCYSLHPKFAVDNDICPMAGSLNYILSCYKMEYEALMRQPFVSSTVKNSSFCRQLASTMCKEPEVNDSVVYDTVCNNSYVCVMLSPKHVLAMCLMEDPQILAKGISCENGETPLENYSATSSFVPNSVPTYVRNAVINTSSITRSDANESNYNGKLDDDNKMARPEVIKNGKLTIEQISEQKNNSSKITDPESSSTEPVTAKELKATVNGAKDKPPKDREQEAAVSADDSDEVVEVEGSGYSALDLTEEDLPSAPEETSTNNPSTSSATPPPVEPKLSNSPTNKESVVVRLSNKIKALEYNMSISSQYLEELSRRYKRQMEEMQRQFNLTIAALNDTSWQAYERDQSHQRDIEKLEEHLANVSSILQRLVEERETLAHTVVEQHLLLMVIEVIVLCMVFTVCSRRRDNYMQNDHLGRNKTPSEDASNSNVDLSTCHQGSDSQGRVRVRRRSVDSITSERNSRLRQRRPSEEALNISGTYQDLLIIEPAIPILMDSVSDRKKKRKSGGGTLKRSKSNASIADKSVSSRRAKRIEKLNTSSAGVLFCGDNIDSNAIAAPSPSPVCTAESLQTYVSGYDPLQNENGSIVCDQVDGCSFHSRAMVPDINVSEKVPCGYNIFSKRHSIACCLNCDNVHKKGAKLCKSMSLSSATEKVKCTQEKVKK